MTDSNEPVEGSKQKSKVTTANKVPLSIIMLFIFVMGNVLGYRFGFLGLLSSRSDMALWGAFPLATGILYLDYLFLSFYFKWIKS